MTISGIEVRPIRFHDLVRLRSMQTDVLAPDQAPGRLGGWAADPLSALPVSRRTRRSFVANVNGVLVGLVDLIADVPNHRWVISRMATCPEVAGEGVTQEAIRRALIVQAVRAAGAARAKRVHATVPDEGDIADLLIDTGFTLYARDSVMLAQRLPAGERAGVTRRQESSDVWSIHQLHHLVTPRPVQYAEALTSNFWDTELPGQGPTRGYVIEDGFEVVAHCRVTNCSRNPVLHMMVHPEGRDLLEPLLRDVVADIASGNEDRIAVVVPDYLQEYLEPLRRLGFEEESRQARLVKYTAVPRRMQFRGVEEIAKEVPERVAAGTPTFLYAAESGGQSSSAPRRESDTTTEQDGFR